MAEYIERDSLGIGCADPKMFDNPAYAEGWNNAIKIINEAPVSDVVPVKHGQWIWKDNYRDHDGYICSTYSCSNCGEIINDKTPYRPNCGCKMINGDDKE